LADTGGIGPGQSWCIGFMGHVSLVLDAMRYLLGYQYTTLAPGRPGGWQKKQDIQKGSYCRERKREMAKACEQVSYY